MDEPMIETLAPTQRVQATADIPELVSQVYNRASMPLRARMVECLLRPVGPLAILTIAAGAFARFVYRLTGEAVPISLDDVARVTALHVMELARYVEQSSPAALLRIADVIGERPNGIAALGASALLMALHRASLAGAQSREIGVPFIGARFTSTLPRAIERRDS